MLQDDLSVLVLLGGKSSQQLKRMLDLRVRICIATLPHFITRSSITTKWMHNGS